MVLVVTLDRFRWLPKSAITEFIGRSSNGRTASSEVAYIGSSPVLPANHMRNMPKVLNKHKDQIPPDAVYIGRPSKWGNPFSHLPNTAAKFKVATRDEAVEKYAEYILSNEKLLADLHELRGKDLYCYCSPKLCHGDVLLELANN